MRRNFNFGNSGSDDEQTGGEYMDSSNYSDGYDDDEDEDEDGIMDIEDMVEYAQIDMMELGMNQRLLTSSIEIAKDSFTWYFMPVEKKLKRVQRIYDKLMELVQNEKKEGDL